MLLCRTNLDWIFVFQNHTMEWRRYRKAFHTSFMSSVLPRYHSIQAQVGAHLLNNLLDTPEKFSNHIKLYVAPPPLLPRPAPGAETSS